MDDAEGGNTLGYTLQFAPLCRCPAIQHSANSKYSRRLSHLQIVGDGLVYVLYHTYSHNLGLNCKVSAKRKCQDRSEDESKKLKERP